MPFSFIEIFVVGSVLINVALAIYLFGLRGQLVQTQSELQSTREAMRFQAGVPTGVDRLDPGRVYRTLSYHSFGGYSYYFVTAAPEGFPMGMPIVQVMARADWAPPLPKKFRAKNLFEVEAV